MGDRKFKILFVSEYYLPHIGGVEIVFMNLAERLASYGHDCSIITSSLPGTKKYEEINCVRVYRVPVPGRGTRYWFTLLSIPKVLKMARQADLLHTTTYNAVFPAWLAARLLRVKSLITIHEVWGDLWVTLSGFNFFTARLHRFLEKLIVRLSFDSAVCVSKYTRDCLKRLGLKEEKLKVIYNGIDNNIFSPKKTRVNGEREKLGLPENRFIYTYYGRPGVSKGVEYLVRAVPLISKTIPDSKLLLILAHDPKNGYENIKKMISDLEIEGNVILLDPVPRNLLPEYIASSDCIVVPSISEGFGFTAAEACAMGKSVVASNVASLPEVVSGRYVLVEPGNPLAIAEGVEKVYKGEAENTGRKTFDWDTCVGEYLEIYRKLTVDK